MARASSERRRSPRPGARVSAPRGRSSASNVEDLLFFTRLRRKAKWVFLLRAIVFGGGFVFFGVGAGGSGIGDYLSDIFNRQPGTGPSVESARERVEKNPRDAEAQRDLANALQAEGEVDEAIAALERYTRLRPRDTDALQQLAGLYNSRALEARERLAAVQADAQGTMFARDLQRSDSPLAQALNQGPIVEAVQARVDARTTAAVESVQEAYRQQADVYKRLSVLLPEDASIFLQLGQAAEFGGDTTTAISAYERFLELAPDDPNARAIKQRVKTLKQFSGALGGG